MAAPNMDQFEAFFRRADLDGDGRISGAEAVGFFQGSNLPKHVLAQVWMHADQSKTGFLGRNDFYNALRLVTVAQSKRELTPDIVKAALFGPAAAKIPPPQINLAALPPQRQNPAASSVGQMGVNAAPTSTQNLAYRGQGLTGSAVNPQYLPSQQNANMRPPQSQGLAGSVANANQQYLPSQQNTNTRPPQSQGLAGSVANANQQYLPSQQNTNTRPPQSQGLAGSVVNQQYLPSQQSPTMRPPQSQGFSGFVTSPQYLPSQQSPNTRPPQSQGLPGSVANQQYLPSQQNPTMRPTQSMPAGSAPGPQQFMPSGSASGPQQFMPAGSAPGPQQFMPPGNTPRPPQSMPTGTAPRPQQGFAGTNVSNASISNDWNGGRTATPPSRPAGITQSVALPTQTSPSPVSPMSQPTAITTKALAVSGNGYPSKSALDSDFFSSATSTPKQDPIRQNYPVSSAPASSSIVPVSSSANPASRQSSLDSLQSAFSMALTNNQIPRTQSLPNTAQQISPSASSPLTTSGRSVGLGNTTSDNSQPPWPKMKPSDVQKYAKVFMEVDTDRDGKITGEQARSLFLSWRLPIDVLKKVWDLSDQDSDSMLSLKEFCFALYLMERYREGRPLPQSLPSNVIFDETLMSMTGHPKIPHGNAAWGVGPGFQQQQGMPGTRPVAPAAGLRPPVQGTPARADGTVLPDQKTSVLDDSYLNDTDNSKQNIETAEKKPEEMQNVILDSKEKIELYRNKMQELVLYKSRCDNRLNEITERASADKREAESLGKKYEEKYKQVAEIASKLTIEEAKLRDIQERKTELQQAIVKMEQGGSADGILQVRADRIQSDLEQLFRALAERCKKHEIDLKSIAMVQLPDGWQPGNPEGAAVWDEDWDKFEDEGFANDLTFDKKNASSEPKPSFIPGENSFDDNPVHGSPVNANGMQENFTNGDYTVEEESSYAHSEDDLARSPRDSPFVTSTVESPSNEFSTSPFAKSSEADAETHRSFDESTWGAFDNNDDVDSVWGFNPKDSDLEKQGDFFKSGDFGLNPVRTGSTFNDGAFQAKSPFAFDDSVPGTPFSKFGNSPRYSEAGDHFDTSRFDSSFSMHESGNSPQAERFTRFDSISSSRDFGNNFGNNHEKFSRFDSISSSKDFGYNPDKFSRFDSMSNSKDFGYNPETLTRFDSMSSSKDFGFGGGQGHARFDSISSSKDLGYSAPFSFDDSDPFGSSGPFKVSSENQSPKKGSDKWSAF
ncbi:uncharacterized protein LOC127087688 isoform X1 [Lathyrus oleraceus]|uniref:Uncharacterized protein n=1 Tax=Pisum sativum TaxID=3888 RepID=A0A9D4WKU7_PEA|nr:uncharacterized protein LOC127087688 isoform X1 [Pisum sativum]KAI5402640.1 hypothetical protein KIW84_050295 [Pisum sativum]